MRGYPAPRAPVDRAELNALMGIGDRDHPWHPSIRGALVTVVVYPLGGDRVEIWELPK